MVTADRYDRPLIAKNDFRDPCRNDSDAKLTGVIAFDNGDIRISNVLFDLLAHPVRRFAALLDELADGYAGDAGARPEKYLRNSMFSDHLGLHLIGIDIKMLGQMNTETQAIEEGSGT